MTQAGLDGLAQARASLAVGAKISGAGLALALLLLLARRVLLRRRSVESMVQGNRPVDMAPAKREPALSVLPPLVLGLAVLTLGLWIPHWLWNFLTRAAALVGA